MVEDAWEDVPHLVRLLITGGKRGLGLKCWFALAFCSAWQISACSSISPHLCFLNSAWHGRCFCVLSHVKFCLRPRFPECGALQVLSDQSQSSSYSPEVKLFKAVTSPDLPWFNNCSVHEEFWGLCSQVTSENSIEVSKLLRQFWKMQLGSLSYVSQVGGINKPFPGVLMTMWNLGMLQTLLVWFFFINVGD